MEPLESIKREICGSLQDFDTVWCKYEQVHIEGHLDLHH